MFKHSIRSSISNFYEKTTSRMSPPQIILISFLFVIFTGTVLLYLPFSHADGFHVAFIDCLFTATSATCVTGLVTMVTATTWTVFGKIVILCLIQIGGLSLITVIFYLMVHSRKKITIKNRLAIQATFNANDLNGIIKMLLMVIRGTFFLEGLGAIILFFYFLSQSFPLHISIAYGIFHSISAFCNAGFDIMGENSLIPYSASIVVNCVVMFLIIVGGLGFSVWGNMLKKVKSFFSSNIKHKTRLTLQTKLVFISTAFLLLSGAICIFILEYNNPETMADFSVPHKILASFFQSVTLRTAGFTSINQFGLHDSSKFISSIFMLIGGSPGGTAGGIKTTTIAIVLCSMVSVAKGNNDISLMSRTISTEALKKALCVIFLIIFALITVTILLSITERNSQFTHTFLDLFYEVSSALGTVGLTTGITPYLTYMGKLLLILCMFMGRVGPVTIMIALTARSNKGIDLVHFPKEEIMIG